MTAIRIRRLLPGDSIEDMTDMLRRAFAPLGGRGLNCTCVDQTVDMTRARIRLGDCFVAIRDDRVVGTITLHAADRASPVRWYREPKVASIHQLAVDPGHQGAGIGQALLRKAETWARSRQYRELALDTPEPARHLHAYYGRHGFRLMDTVQLEGKSYRSVIFSKTIGYRVNSILSDYWPAQHSAAIALLPGEAQWLMRLGRVPATPDSGSLDPNPIRMSNRGIVRNTIVKTRLATADFAMHSNRKPARGRLLTRSL